MSEYPLAKILILCKKYVIIFHGHFNDLFILNSSG